ncbi:MAG: tryptophan synthase subunit alpha [Burkholderiaceae bacterium]|nr:tryptophan synthase subunit alpha [Burkholderiales bacterium]MCZ8102433.1 tryptophan synthase subunit alpha [Burkholderiales bacterium]MCZ8337134.1 tryptophan synthase subunit alpha [Burkholderiaceae bacterium]
MSRRIDDTFARLRVAKRRALIPYFTAGHPSREHAVPMMHALAEAGADVIELGVPFSDPMADGPVIQKSGEAALALGVGLGDVLAWVREFRRTDDTTPVVLMGYLNPIERMGAEAFTKRAAEAGVDGVLVVDLPPEEAETFGPLLKAHGLDPIFLLAPTSTKKRIEQVGRIAAGYVYYVSLKGVTGSAALNVDEVLSALPAIREATGLPVGVGFGIRDGATAAAIAKRADAVVIGTRLIQEIEAAGPAHAIERAAAFMKGIREAMDAGAAAAQTQETAR